MELQKFPTYPRITAKNFRSWNEAMFAQYNNERVYNHVNPIIRFVEKKRVNAVLDGLKPLRQSDYILAAGCGEGYIEQKLARYKLLLVDISKEAIKRAKHKLKNMPNKKFLVADLEKLPVQANTFDKIECSEVIEHVLSPKKLLTELQRVTKPKGVLSISFPNEPLINAIKKILIKLRIFSIFFPNIPKDMTEEWHLRSYTLKSFKKDLDQRWEIVQISGIPFSFLPLRYVVVCRKTG